MTATVMPPSVLWEIGQMQSKIAAMDAAPMMSRFRIKLFSDTQVVSTGDGKFTFSLTEDEDGLSLVKVFAYVTTVSSSGSITVQIHNVTQAADMLSTVITIPVSTFNDNSTWVLDLANDDVALGNLIRIDVDSAGTGAKGLGVGIWFGNPGV